MRKIYFVIIFLFLSNNVSASIKENILDKFQNIENVSFDFEQNVNGKIENGNCIIAYPQKIYCKYNLGNKKVLVSNGKLNISSAMLNALEISFRSIGWLFITKKPLFSNDEVKNSKTSLLVFFRSLKEIVGILCMLHYTGLCV